MRRTGLGEGDVDDVILGNCYPSGETPAIGRVAALDAGLGVGVPGLQIDRRCGSGLQAVLYAAGQVATGAARVVVAGGAESMRQVEHYALLRAGRARRRREPDGPARRGPGTPPAAGLTRCPAACSRPRRTCAASTASAARSRTSSRSARTSAPSAAQDAAASPTRSCRSPSRPARGTPEIVVDRDEHPRPGTTLGDPGDAAPDPASGSTRTSTVTAGNASGQNDGAAMCVVTTREEAERRGLRPLLRAAVVGGRRRRPAR